MSISNILTLLFGSGLLTTLAGYLYARVKANEKETAAIKKGVQALLRDRLYDKYEKYSECGYAPIRARENFENMWDQYHTLGKNGVMDDIHNKFMALPTEPPTKGDCDDECKS